MDKILFTDEKSVPEIDLKFYTLAISIVHFFLLFATNSFEMLSTLGESIFFFKILFIFWGVEQFNRAKSSH